MTCDKCNTHVEAVHVGVDEDGEGRRTDRWEPGPCRNPQCSNAPRPPRF